MKGALYASPAVVFVLAFFVVPLALVGRMSASDWPLLVGGRGLNLPDNYTAATGDRLFWPAVWFTLKYTAIVVVALLVLGMVMALLVQERRRGTGLFRAAYFLPVSIGLAAASLLFSGLYSPAVGGPDNSTTTVVMLIYRAAFRQFDLGAAAALSVMVLVVLLAINVTQFRFLRRGVEEER